MSLNKYHKILKQYLHKQLYYITVSFHFTKVTKIFNRQKLLFLYYIEFRHYVLKILYNNNERHFSLLYHSIKIKNYKSFYLKKDHVFIYSQIHDFINDNL